MRPRKILGKLDLFKRPLLLRVARQETVSTNCGLFLSFLIYLSLGAFFSQSDFFQRANPKIITEFSQSPSAPPIIYGNRPFFFALKDDSGEISSDPTYFTISVNFVKTGLNNDDKMETYMESKSFHQCKQSDFNRSIQTPLMTDSFCLDDNNFTLEGSLGDISTTMLQININICRNSSLNGNFCKPMEEIRDYFAKHSFYLDFANRIFQFKSYESPTFETLYRSVYKLDVNVNRLVNINFQKVFIISEERSITRNESMIEEVVFEKESVDIGPLISFDDPILSISFMSSKNLVTATRTYQTLPQACAELGGLLSILIAVGNILHKIDNAIYLTTLLMNLLYSFPEEEKKNARMRKLGSKLQTSLRESTKNFELMDTKTKKEINFTEAKSQVFNENIDINTENLPKLKLPKILNSEDMMRIEEKASNSLKELEDEKKFIKFDNETGSKLKNSSLETSQKIPRSMGFHSERIEAKVLEQEDSIIITSPKNLRNSEEKIPIPTSPVLNNFTSNFEMDSIEKSPKKGRQKEHTNMRLSRFMKNFSFSRNKKDSMRSLEDFVKLNEKTSRISFNVFDFFKLITKRITSFGLTFKEKLFMKATEVFEKEIDIVKILQRVQDIEKLKFILLNDQQRTLFEVLEKPMIFVDNESKFINMKSSEFVKCLSRKETALDIKITKAFQYYQELEKKDSEDPIDKKLFSLIHGRFETYKKYFDK